MGLFDKEKSLEEQQIILEKQEILEETEKSTLQQDAFDLQQSESITDLSLAVGGEEGSVIAVTKVQDSTEQNMPLQVNDMESEVKERLQEEKEKLKERLDQQAEEEKEKKASAEIKYNRLEDAYWKTVSGFHKTADVKTAMGVRYNQYDSMDLFALRNELLNDTDKKSDSFMDMYKAIDSLLTLSDTKGMVKGKDDQEIQRDFSEVFFTATVQVNQYIKAHSGFRFTKKGDRRMQVALRMQTLLKQLDKECEKAKEEVVAKNMRMAGYQSEGLSDEEIEEREKQFSADAATEDMLRIIETKGFASEGNAEEANKTGEWIEKGYTKDLKEMITTEEVAQADKERQNEFLAYLMDEQNRKVANRMAISILLDSSKDATLNMPWLKTELNDYLAKKLSDKTKEKTPEFVELAKKEIETFKTENAERIEKYKANLEKVHKKLHLPLDAANLYDYAEMRELITETDESVLDEKLNSMRERVRTTDRMINDMLKERYSIRTRTSIGQQIVKYMGALRVFGSADQILLQTASFLDMLKFTAPHEYMEEQRIAKNMEDLKIDKVRRDEFVNYLTDNKPGDYLYFDDPKLESKKKMYVKMLKANSKAFDKYVAKKGRMLTKEQWESLEALQLKNGAMTPEEFMDEMEKVSTTKAEGKLLSRNEYLTDREFNDAEKEPARIKHAEIEQKAIKALGTSMDKKFFTAITTEHDPMEKYKKMDALLAGKTEESKDDKKRQEELVAERKNHVKHILQRSGVPKDKWDEYVDKFARHITGISEDGTKLHEDERLEMQRKNLENFGVKDWNEALEVMELAIPQMVKGEAKELEAAQKNYKSSLKRLSIYDGGKYADYAEMLMNIPEVFAAMMNEDEATVDAFLKDVLDERLKGFIEGVSLAGTSYKAGAKSISQYIPDAIRMQYAYEFMRSAYEGRLKGDGQFFAENMTNYNERVLNIRPDGDNTISDNIKEVKEALEKRIYYKKKRGSEANNLNISVMIYVEQLLNSQEDFSKLLKYEELEKYAFEKLDQIIDGVQENVIDEATKEAITKKNEDVAPEKDEEQRKNIKEIREKKIEGREKAGNYRAIDIWRLTKVRANNSLVRVTEKGMEEKVNAEKADAMRGKLERFCSSFELPPILRDALIEEGSAGVKDGIQSDKQKLKNNAFAMSKLYNLLTKEYKDDPPMTAEEATMYIVRLYGSPEERTLFDEPDKYNMIQARTTTGYKQFRQMYQTLRALETDETDDMDIERERAETSKNLRTMMVTKIGLLGYKDYQFKTREEWEKYNDDMLGAIERNREYLARSAQVKKVIRKKVDEEDRERGLNSSDHYLDRMTAAIFDYFKGDMVDELIHSEFKEDEWSERIDKVRKEKKTLENMVFRKDAVSSEEYKKFNSVIDEGTEIERFGRFIENCKNSSDSKTEEYNGLDEGQKKLFIAALMVMDYGSLGYGTNGTAELLNAPAKKAKDMEKVQAALNKYVSGGGFDLELNYKEAFNKLISMDDDYGIMSEVAFEKAMEFTKQITAKKNAFGEKDWTRLNDGYSSIVTAGTKYGKEAQLKEMEAVREQVLTAEDVRAKMLEYVERAKEDPVFNELGPIKERFEKMSKEDMKLFIRLMQDRTVLDLSPLEFASGKHAFVDEQKRFALWEALTGDPGVQEDVMKGFDDPEACMQVITNALSFQLRDDINSTGKDLTQENFLEGVLNRKSLLDWDLVDRAFMFMDQIKERRTAVYALSHATKYIDQTGNGEAIVENRKLTEKYKKKEDFKQQDFENYIKEQAAKDEDEDIRRVVAGYHALTDKEKNLFFKVLGRRDLLDISKRDYMASFMGKKERNYVNQTGRDKLIDQYIAQSLEGNIGVTLNETAHFDAMQSLFTTQIDDTEHMSSEKNIEDMMAAERNLFMHRSTAVDWKLFKRALNFVNRATEELEYAEGNAQLYRGAGNLVDNGKMDMKYTFLRKNFHRTGNQWARRIASIFERNVKEQVPVDTILEVLVKAVDAGQTLQGYMGLRRGSSEMRGLAWIKEKATIGAEAFGGKQLHEDTIKITAYEVDETKKKLTDEEKAEAEMLEKQRRDESTYKEHLAEGAGKLVEHGGALLDGVADTVDFVREELSQTLADHFESMSSLVPTMEVKQKADQNNIVEQTINKGDMPEEVKEQPKFAGPKATKITGIIKTVSSGIVSVLLGSAHKLREEGEEEPTAEELAKTKLAAEEFENQIKKLVGEDTAKKLLENEEQLYNMRETVSQYVGQTLSYINYAKKCVKHVENIAMSAMNIGLLNDGAEKSKDKRKEDDKKLEKAKEKRLDAEQGEKAEKTLNKHRGMTDMAKELGVRLEKFNITGEAVNFAIETVNVAAGKLNAAEKVISKAIQEGLQFALFACRIASDRNVLSQYFMKTEAGKALVEKTRNGFIKFGDEEMAKKLDDSMKTQEKHGSSSFIDILSDARGYEHTSELVENTAMSMAQSIVFCASNYNPMAETRLMAITVMSVMGLDKEIGSTEPATVEKLFNKFSMSR